MNLLVISDAHHITKNGKKQAYAPYVKEMDLWMKNVSQTTIMAPHKINKPLLSKAFAIQDFKHVRTTRLEFDTLFKALKSTVLILYQFCILLKHMYGADHIHLRAPGNLTLLGCIAQIFFPLKAKTAKYAGNWDPQAEQPLSYRLQKWLLTNTLLTKNIQVIVYGEWPNQSKNIKPFFTASYSKADRTQIKKTLNKPLHFVFVGTLSKNKNPQLLIELVQRLNQNGIPATAEFYGDGPMMEELEQKSLPEHFDKLSTGFVEGAVENRLENLKFTFHGNQPAEVVKQAYQKAHFVFLASQSEGWPKAIAEGMWHGCIPIATPVSCVPWMLNNSDNTISESSRGLLFQSIEQTIQQIKELIAAPEKFEQISKNAQNWSQQYTLESFEIAIQELLK